MCSSDLLERDPLVTTFFGPKWLEMIPVVAGLALAWAAAVDLQCRDRATRPTWGAGFAQDIGRLQLAQFLGRQRRVEKHHQDGAVAYFEQVFTLGEAGQGRRPEIGGEDGALGVFAGRDLIVQDVERRVVDHPLVLQGVLVDALKQAPVPAARDLADPAPA